MKNADQQLARTKYELRKLKEKRVKTVIWKLSKSQIEYIPNLGYSINPYLYEIRTKAFQSPKQLNNSILKDIHYANKKGKRVIVKKLRAKDKKVLSEYGIKFHPIKFEIILF